MPSHSETRSLPYSADQMFDLVADVAKYPEFLPWCAAARIRSRKPEGENEIIEADLVIATRSAAIPAVSWTTMPPAKSFTPISPKIPPSAIMPPPQIQCTTGA